MIETIRNRWHPLWRVRKFRLAAGALRLVDRPIWGRIAEVEYPVRMYRISHAAYRTVQHGPEPETYAVLSRLPDGLFWDVGANFGFYSWLRGGGVMFEPDPRHADLIAATIRDNNLDGFELVRAAVTDRPGTVTFTQDRPGGDRGSVSQHRGAAQREVVVQAVRLDDRNEAPVVVKIDVEGHELAVLRGAEQTLQTHRPVVIVEARGVFEGTDQAVEALLHDLGYRTTLLDGSNVLAEPA